MDSFTFGLTALPTHLNAVQQKLQDAAPDSVDGLRRVLSAHGKRLRPSLVFAVAHYGGKKIDNRVITVAAAIEMVHIASLIHDDSMDGGTLRWGQPTINAREGSGMALLAGDYLLGKGCALAASVSAELAVIVAEAITQLCSGQAYELRDNFNVERTEASLLCAIAGKTSAMFMAACRVGAVLAGMSVAQTQVLTDFAYNYGIAFQYSDDMQDFIESPESTGKSVGGDIREGNYTLPVIVSLQGSRKDDIKKLLKQNNAPAAKILEILQQDQAIQRTAEHVENYKQKALNALATLENSELAQVLMAFVRNSLPPV